MRETHRFETLVSYFTSPQEFQIEFMVACMQFINIVVHSVEVSCALGHSLGAQVCSNSLILTRIRIRIRICIKFFFLIETACGV
jgi:hypothetical protein